MCPLVPLLPRAAVVRTRKDKLGPLPSSLCRRLTLGKAAMLTALRDWLVTSS